jgi:hypothetical protein
LTDLGSVTIAIYPASFNLTLLRTIHETMVYALASHNKLNYLWLKLSYYNTFPIPIDVHIIIIIIIIIQVSQSWKPI